MPPAHVPLPGSDPHTLDCWLLLRAAETAAEALPEARRASAVALHAAGATRVDAALGQRGVPALVLARAAVTCFLEAAVTALGAEAPQDGGQLAAPLGALWEQYEALAADGRVPPVPASLAAVRAHTVAGQTPDDEIAAHGDGRVDECLALARFLEGAVELRTPGRIRAERKLRIAAAVGLVVFLVAELIIHRPRSRSLALHAPVTASSRRPGLGPPEDLTNGKVETNAAFGTKDEPDPWITVDLGAVSRISEVTLVNGDDHEDDSLPLRVETSADGKAWEAAASATSHFTQAAPAELRFAKRGARFVRVHGRPGGALYLSEVEVR